MMRQQTLQLGVGERGAARMGNAGKTSSLCWAHFASPLCRRTSVIG